MLIQRTVELDHQNNVQSITNLNLIIAHYSKAQNKILQQKTKENKPVDKPNYEKLRI